MKKLMRQELKSLKGGVWDPTRTDCQCENSGSYDSPVTGLTMAQAKQCSMETSSHWCCDSCCTASWADHSGCSS